MKILVTGGAGFVGCNVINKLLEDTTNEITVIDNLSTGFEKNIPLDKVKFIELDCSDEKIQCLNIEVDCIIHIAGQASKEESFNNVFNDLDSNAKSTLNLLEFSRKINCKRFIFISSVCVYGGITNAGIYNENSEINYDTFYSIHKYVSEKYLLLYKKHYDIDYTIFRLFTCYGPGQDLNANKGMVGIYLNQFLNDSPNVIIKGSIERYRDFVFVEDVAYIINDSIKNKLLYNEIFNLGSGVKTTIKHLLSVISLIGDFKKDILLQDETLGDMAGCVSDNSKLLNIYKGFFNFTSLNDGIKMMIDHYKGKLVRDFTSKDDLGFTAPLVSVLRTQLAPGGCGVPVKPSEEKSILMNNNYKLYKISCDLNGIKNCITKLKEEYSNTAFVSYIDGEFGCRAWFYNSVVKEFVQIQKNENKTVIGLVFKGNKLFLNDICDIVIEIQSVTFNFLPDSVENNIDNSWTSHNHFNHIVPSSKYSGNDGWDLNYIRGTHSEEYEKIINELNFSNIFFTTHYDGSRVINSKLTSLSNDDDLSLGLINNIPFNTVRKYCIRNYYRKNNETKNNKNDHMAIWIRNTNKHPARNISPDIYNSVFNYCNENKKHLHVFLDLIPVDVVETEFIHIMNIREDNIPLFDKFVDICKDCYIFIGSDSGPAQIISNFTKTNLIMVSLPNEYISLEDKIYTAYDPETLIKTLNNLYN